MEEPGRLQSMGLLRVRHGAPLIVQVVNNLPAMQETMVQFLGQKDSPGEGIGYPLQYSWVSLIA